MELIVSIAIIMIFFISLVMLLTTGSKIYLREVTAGNAEVMLETVSEDIKGYMMYGTDVRVMYVVTGKDGEVIPGVGEVGSIPYDVKVGNEIYLDKSKAALDTLLWDKNDGSQPIEIVATVANFYGNGVDLGYKKIHLAHNGEDTYVQGLAYDMKYYRTLKIDLRIYEMEFDFSEPVVPNLDKRGIYEIDVTGTAAVGKMEVRTKAAVTGWNEKE